MESTNKRYVHDHASSYKNRGEKLGSSNRFVRAHRANEDRKALRLDEITKRRGLVLSLVNECNLSLEENTGKKKTTAKAKDKAIAKAKGNHAFAIFNRTKLIMDNLLYFCVCFLNTNLHDARGILIFHVSMSISTQASSLLAIHHHPILSCFFLPK